MKFSELSTLLLEQGPLAVVFIVLLLLFYNLVWKVWTTAMNSKDKEIERPLNLLEMYHEISLQKPSPRNLSETSPTDVVDRGNSSNEQKDKA